MSKIIKALMLNTILPGTSKQGSKVKTKKSFIEIYNAIVDGILWVSNGSDTIGYSVIEYNPAETCWVYISDDGVVISPVEEEIQKTSKNAVVMTKEDYSFIVVNGERIIKEIFGDLLK